MGIRNPPGPVLRFIRGLMKTRLFRLLASEYCARRIGRSFLWLDVIGYLVDFGIAFLIIIFKFILRVYINKLLL